jgi:hypothetical protein
VSEQPAKRTQALVAWLLVAACISLILGLGGAEFGAKSTSRYLLPMLRWLFPDLSIRTYLDLIVWIRKGAHVAEYALLGFLAFRAVFLTVHSALARIALLSLGVAATVAVMDEIRQTLLPERTGSAWDIALDVSGALAAIGLALWIKRRAQEAKPRPGEAT